MQRKPKRWIPTVISLTLILIICLANGVSYLIERYSPSKERADLYDLYQITDDTEAAVFVYNTLIQEKARLYQGEAYLPVSYVTGELNKRIYFDEQEKILLYTLPDHTVKVTADMALSDLGWDETAGISAPVWFEESAVCYVSCAFISSCTDIRITVFEEPGRLYIDTSEGLWKTAEISANTQVRRLGGIKSDIVADAASGTTVYVLDAMDEWSRVRTEDGYIGYVQNKRLTNSSVIELISDYEEPVWTSQTRDYDICLVWHQVFDYDTGDTLESLLESAQGVNVISPTWFSLSDNEGNFTSLAELSYVEKAHELGLEVWALIDNFSADVNSYEVLSHTSTRQALVSNLMTAADEYELDGINIDFESLSEETGLHFAQFIRELSVACREKGIVLSVDNYALSASTGFYDRAEQGAVADYVIIMGYDEHWRFSDAGSTSSLPFLQDVLESTLSEVPQDKVIAGLPFYTRVWEFDADLEIDGSEDPLSAQYVLSSSAVGMTKALQLLSDGEAEQIWDDELGQYYGEYVENNSLYRIWLEDAESIQKKLDLTAAYDVGGIAFWKLGLESDDVWPEIGDYMGIVADAEDVG